MKQATFDKSRNLKLYARIGETGTPIILKFRNADGTPKDIASKDFRVIVKRRAGQKNLFVLSIGDGLTVQGDDNEQLKIEISQTLSDQENDTAFWTLFSVSENKTWLNGSFRFHNGEFDGVEQTDDIVINENGVEVYITLVGEGIAGAVEWADIEGDPADNQALVDYIAAQTPSVDLESLGTTLQTAANDTPLDADTFNFYDAVDAILKKVSWANIKATLKTYFDTVYDAVGSAASVLSSLNSHTSDTSNPHNVTKGQVGLGNVDNTSDANKPISSATQTALNLKQDLLGFTPENVANKENTTLDNSTTKYPTNRLVKSTTDGLQTQIDDLGTYQAQPPVIPIAFSRGATMVNKTITWSANAVSVDGYTISSITYQHVYADNTSGLNKVTMVGSTSQAAVIPSGASGKYMGIEVTATDSNGGVTTATFYNSDQVSAAFYPLDNITGVVVCNMLKKPSAAFVGNAITLRATNGGTQYSYGFSGDDLNWAAISAQAGGTGIFYEYQGLDLSGNSNTRTHTNFAAEPQLDYVNKKLVWTPTKSGSNGNASSLDLGTGNFTVFIYLKINQIKDNAFAVYAKQTAFNNAMFELQWLQYRYAHYLGNVLHDDIFSGPNKWELIMISRNGTTVTFRAGSLVLTWTETAANLTSTGVLNRNGGTNGGSGDFDETAFILATSDASAHYDNLKKYLQHESV